MPENFWLCIPVVCIAALVRGYSGFGFAAIAVVGFNFVMPPQQSIPIVLGLDLVCSISLWRQAKKQADYGVFKALTAGSFIGIPIGLGLLLVVPAELLKLLICLIILISSLLLIIDIRIRHSNQPKIIAVFGLLSGMGTASASVGGPVIVLYMLSSALNAQTQRATMILFFIVSEVIALVALLSSGIIDMAMLTVFLLLIIPTLLTARIGQWLFNRKPPISLKHFALPVLIFISLIGMSASLASFA